MTYRFNKDLDYEKIRYVRKVRGIIERQLEKIREIADQLSIQCDNLFVTIIQKGSFHLTGIK